MTGTRLSILFMLIVLPRFFTMAQDTKWNGFMDVNWAYDQKKNNNSFNLGQLDIYIVSDITDRVSFLTENTFTIASDGHFKVAIERAIVKYEINNYLNFLIGKHHTPVSYWNNTYHHGRVLQPTTTRPFLFDYNLFAFHTTGLIINGDYIGKNNFGYQFVVGNGTVEHSSFRDPDNYKSLSLTTHLYPVENFKVMSSVYYNRISKGIMSYQGVELLNDIDQTLYSLALSYMPSAKRFEFLAEGMYVKNRSMTASQLNSGFYAYAGYHISKFTPYYRFDYIDIDNDDLFFVLDKTNASTTGVRYSFSHLANIKLEWMHVNSQMTGTNNRILMQFGIGF